MPRLELCEMKIVHSGKSQAKQGRVSSILAVVCRAAKYNQP